MERIALYNDSFQNWKSHDIQKAQLILTDIPFQLGSDAYGSNPQWWEGKPLNGKKENVAGKSFFDTDSKAGFRIAEFFHFCSNLLIKEPREKGKAPCMILFCAFEQMFELIEEAKKHGFNHYIPLVFRKKYSAQVLKANMRPVGNCEYGLIFYREKLPKFNNYGRMVFTCMDWQEDKVLPKIHPTQKPIPLLEFLINTFTDVNDVVIDCCAGSGTTLLAAKKLGRKAYGFELKREYVNSFYKILMPLIQEDMFIEAERKIRKEELLTLFQGA